MEFSHLDEKGKVNMVDVGEKIIQKRIAKAIGKILLNKETIKLIKENQLKKGDLMNVAKIAGIQAAKQTSQLIPLCHNLLLTKINIKTFLENDGVIIESEIHSFGKTGVEMEALNAVSIALLTIYDMCKSTDKNMIIEKIKLTEKIKI
ncbi:MAG: cyclic pyranopterin monophosphate synthase MoaC [Bacteroidetes bacterium 4572_128]|nr:MAG: cyclic pyranopterin monophosphate synthase MoaC [Bacteroidetes bacterium 4572_128]